jgi:DNA-binding beta-propeller fold protein YncE
MRPHPLVPLPVLVRPLALAALAACLLAASPVHAAETRAYVFTTDFGTGAIADAHFGPPRTVTPNVASVWSDAALRVFGGLLYVVNRSGADNIQVLDPANAFATVKQFSVGNGANPHDIALASPTKAYVTRYDSADLWIVNPQTGAHTGTISLAGFADADGIPEMDHMALWAGRLFVSIERLDRNNFYAPAGGSLLAVIDPVTDAVIDVDPGTPGTQGIPLPAQNPTTEMLIDAAGKLLVGCTGNYGALDGGVVRIDPGAMSVEATEVTESALGGDLNDVAVSSASRGFAVISDASFNTLLRSYDRGTGLVTGTPFSTSGFDIADVEVNDRGELWLCDRTAAAPGLRVFDAATGTQLTTGTLGTGLPPQDIAFDAAVTTGVAPPGRGAVGLSLERVAPNPSHGAVTVSFAIGASATGEAELICHDVSGRIVRRLSRVCAAPGRYDWTWDGRDAAGRAPGAGVYFLELRAGGLVQRGRALVLR